MKEVSLSLITAFYKIVALSVLGVTIFILSMLFLPDLTDNISFIATYIMPPILQSLIIVRYIDLGKECDLLQSKLSELCMASCVEILLEKFIMIERTKESTEHSIPSTIER